MAAKHILRYIRGTVEYGLLYECRGSVQLASFTDVDWAGCVEDRKSTSGSFSIESGIVSWFSRKKKSIALSLAKAEYMAASMAACEGMWLRKLWPYGSARMRPYNWAVHSCRRVLRFSLGLCPVILLCNCIRQVWVNLQCCKSSIFSHN